MRCERFEKHLGFVALVVLCLGLGIGVNTTLFSLFNAVLLKGPTARDPQRLVHIKPGNGDPVHYATTRISGLPAGFTDLAISDRTALHLSSADTVQSLRALQVSPNYFELFGVPWQRLAGRSPHPTRDSGSRSSTTDSRVANSPGVKRSSGGC